MSSSAHNDLSYTPVLCGAREKRIIKIHPLFAEKTAFQVNDRILFRAELAETESQTDGQVPMSAFYHARMAQAISRSPGNIIKLK